MTSEIETAASDAIAANKATMFRECGRTVLWIGNECQHWTHDQFAQAAQFARSHNIDCICPKVANGNVPWYGTVAQLQAIRQRVLQQGVGFIPFVYSYGPGAADGMETIKEMLQAGPICQIDMEVEWNGKAEEAAAFAAELRPLVGLVSISTWADPNEQAWHDVALALAPATNGWTFQEYNNKLEGDADGEYPQGIFTCQQPGLDLTQEFGANDQLAIIEDAIARGCQTFYFWEYQVAQANPGLLNQLVTFIREKVPAPPR